MVALNAVLLVRDPLKCVDPESLSSAHCWPWWASQNYQSETHSPDIVFLGSSLLLNPIWENEARFLNKNVDIVLNRRIRYLETVIKNDAPGKQATCLNLALPGARVSDDYMVMRSLFTKDRKPRVVVFGLSPRDFIEDGFKYPVTSSHFHFFAEKGDVDELVDLAMPQLWQKIAYYLHRSVYLDRNKEKLTALAAHNFADTTNLAHTPNLTDTTSLTTGKNCKPVLQTKESRTGLFQAKLEPGIFIAPPSKPDYFLDGDYIQARAKFVVDKVGYENQRRWFELCLATCQKQDIQPVIVNMPITQRNIDLYAPGVYQNCVGMIASTASRFKCPFLDLQGKIVDRSDFMDMCHMDASGGRKFLDYLGNLIVTDSRTKTRLNPDIDHFQLAGRSALTK